MPFLIQALYSTGKMPVPPGKSLTAILFQR